MKNFIPLALVLLFAACTKSADEPAGAGQAKAAPQVSVAKFLRGDLKALKGWEDLRGKAVVLEFWGTYCEPCIENIPHLNELSEKFKGKPVVFLSLSREPQAKVEEFLRTHELKGNVAADAAEAFRSFKVNGIPHTVLIDKDGLVRAVTYPSHVSEKTVEDLLAGRQPAGEEQPTETAAAPSAEGAESFFSAGPSAGVMLMRYSDEEFSAGNMSLSSAIGFIMRETHGVEYKNVPPELLKKKYDIAAKVRREAGCALKLRELAVAGLNGAFPFKVSVLKKNRKVYLLEKAGGGKPGLVPSAGRGGSRRFGSENDEAHMEAKGGHMYELAAELEGWLGEPVLDETGLGEKQFDFEIKFSPLTAKAAGAALTEKLGLKLVEARRDVEITEVVGARPDKAGK